MNGHSLSVLVFAPLAAVFVLFFFPRKWDRFFHYAGVLVTALVFSLSLRLFGDFTPGAEGYQFEETFAWIPSWGITYYVGLDGISLVLVMLTTLLTFIALASSDRAIHERRKEFVASILILETAMLGTFAALDGFLFYVFWEAVLIPMYFLIGVFGGPRRIYATLKFFLFTMAGSVFMLVALLAVYSMHADQAGYLSTAIPDLYNVRFTLGQEAVLFAMFFLAFAIKIPIFPFHTWLPDAHVEAPTAGSVILAGVLLKMGGYGMLRLAIPIFPNAAVMFAPYIAALGLIGIVYGALVALAQEDVKKLIAYSSVSHMGFVVLGTAALTTVSLGGAVFIMISHGLTTGCLFMLVGMLYERRHTRMIADFGGLARSVPKLATVFLVITLASVGLPGLCGFVGEFLVLNGSFHALVLGRPAWVTGIAVLGIILGAAYMLWMVERVFFGKLQFEENMKLRDLRWVEAGAVLLPLVLVIILGLKPNLILSRIEPSVETLSKRVQAAQQASHAGEVHP